MNFNIYLKSIAYLFTVIFFISYIVPFFIRVNPEYQQSLVLRFGEAVRTINSSIDSHGPGIFFKLPWERIISFDKRLMLLDIPPKEVLAADQERIVVDSVAYYRIRNPLMFYKSVNNDYNLRVRLSRILESSLRKVLGKYDSETLISNNKSTIMDELKDSIVLAVRGLDGSDTDIGVDIIDVRMKKTNLPKENLERVFERMSTERQQQAALIRAEGEEKAVERRAFADREKDRILSDAILLSEETKGIGDAEANNIYQAAYSVDSDFYKFYQSMKSYIKISQGTSYILSPDSPFFKYFSDYLGQ